MLCDCRLCSFWLKERVEGGVTLECSVQRPSQVLEVMRVGVPSQVCSRFEDAVKSSEEQLQYLPGLWSCRVLCDDLVQRVAGFLRGDVLQRLHLGRRPG